MTTLQEKFERDFPDKSVREIFAGWKYENFNFTNRNLDLREYKFLKTLELEYNRITSINVSRCKDLKGLVLEDNNLTSVDFLNQLPNPEKLETLEIWNNNIQPTDISFFSKFVNLKELKIGTMKYGLEEGKHNKFYGSLKSYQNLTKLEDICIEATNVNEGLEYLPFSLAQSTAKKAKEEGKERGGYICIECSPHDTNAKCKAIQDQLRPFNYDLESWQLAHPEKMLISRPEYFISGVPESCSEVERKRERLKIVLEYKKRILKEETVIHEEDGEKVEVNLEMLSEEKIEEGRKQLKELEGEISKEKWINALTNKITQTEQELTETKNNLPEKAKRIQRLEDKLNNLKIIKTLLEELSIEKDHSKDINNWYQRQLGGENAQKRNELWNSILELKWNSNQKDQEVEQLEEQIKTIKQIAEQKIQELENKITQLEIENQQTETRTENPPRRN